MTASLVSQLGCIQLQDLSHRRCDGENPCHDGRVCLAGRCTTIGETGGGDSGTGGGPSPRTDAGAAADGGAKPLLLEDFEAYSLGVWTGGPPTPWDVTGTTAVISSEADGGQRLELSGTAEGGVTISTTLPALPGLRASLELLETPDDMTPSGFYWVAEPFSGGREVHLVSISTSSGTWSYWTGTALSALNETLRGELSASFVSPGLVLETGALGATIHVWGTSSTLPTVPWPIREVGLRCPPDSSLIVDGLVLRVP